MNLGKPVLSRFFVVHLLDQSSINHSTHWSLKVLEFKVANSTDWKYWSLKTPGICFTGFGKYLLGNVKCVPSVGFYSIKILLNSGSRTQLGSLWCSPRPLSYCRKVLEKSLNRSLNSEVTEERVPDQLIWRKIHKNIFFKQ